MSSENIELVRRASEAIQRRPKPDWELVNELVHSEHEFVPATPGRSSFKGASGYREWLEESNEVLPWQGEFDGAIEVGPRLVVSQSTLRFRGASSEVEVEQRLWFLIRVADGKIVRTEAFTDPKDALRSAGLSE